MGIAIANRKNRCDFGARLEVLHCTQERPENDQKRLEQDYKTTRRAQNHKHLFHKVRWGTPKIMRVPVTHARERIRHGYDHQRNASASMALIFKRRILRVALMAEMRQCAISTGSLRGSFAYPIQRPLQLSRPTLI